MLQYSMRSIISSLNYTNYRFTAGYMRMTQEIAPSSITPNAYASRFGHACFENTFKGQTIPFPTDDRDGWMGFRIHARDIEFKLMSDSTVLLSGISGKDDGLFEIKDIVWETSALTDGAENMKVPYYSGACAELRDDRIVYGKNYIPVTSELRLNMSVESDVTIYSFLLGVNEDRALLRNPSTISLGNAVKIQIHDGGLLKLV